jgi:benzil reductase ((S)-benzoin forming)
MWNLLMNAPYSSKEISVNYYFITGTSREIGKAIADELLLSNDAQVIGIGRKNVHSANNFSFINLDLSDTGAVARFQFPEMSSADKIVLVNNAGLLGEVKKVGSLTNGNFERVINTNLTAVMMLTNKFLAAFQKKNVPLVVLNISSGAGKNPIDGWSAYCASKSGLDMFSRVLAEELAISGKKHIRVFSVGPGVVDTGMQDQIRMSSMGDFSRIEQFLEYKSTGQLADPRLIAQKLLGILGLPEKFTETVFSVKEVNSVNLHTN